jgi:hypothetical protein
MATLVLLITNQEHDMTESELAALRALSARGYAVVVWTPDELRGADPEQIEQLMIERGAAAIDTLGDDSDD